MILKHKDLERRVVLLVSTLHFQSYLESLENYFRIHQLVHDLLILYIVLLHHLDSWQYL